MSDWRPGSLWMAPADPLDFGARQDGLAGFLDTDYGQRPVWLGAAANLAGLPLPDADELAWLATQDDVESRLVLTEHGDGEARYRAEAGPFDAARLGSLPPSDWTLLIHDVEKHLPDLREWFGLVPFVPDWCVDDLMISVAAPGGSVGPHVDRYSVFLVQADGSRHWQWTDEALAPAPELSRQLELVEPFTSGEARTASAGDVLYLPPGTAHHGVARSFCTTCSIGMRGIPLDCIAVGADADRLFAYRPADDHAEPGRIADAAVAALRQELPGLSSREIVDALGAAVTNPKRWLAPERPRHELPTDGPLAVHGMALAAWTPESAWVNGERLSLDAATAPLFARLCERRKLDVRERRAWSERAESAALLGRLWRLGMFDAP